MKICFLVSGGGGNLKFLHQALSQGIISNLELSVVADRDCDAIRFSQKNGLHSNLIEYSRSNPGMLRDVLDSIGPDIIVTNWHKIIDADTVDSYSNKMINLHYSLLPAFGSLIGVEPIKKAYEKGCKFIGPTCHFVDEGVDTGDIIAQAIFMTNIPYEDAITKMFRMGCLTLLNGIVQVANENILNQGLILNIPTDSFYCPDLNFNPTNFNEIFWNKLASL
ncbi:phosphoribosylglycinamide formyltransferase [Vibrio metschnikovii]|uniref:phosphoribosylglycinamide formyltransferase n=1 Tax=Vibrio metschnikovii TaxID=28172 RepID=UPI001C30A7E6|nr:formyltransferase family protein [Vibrio metschnikovii]